MKEIRVAVRYAKALFELVLEKDLVEEVYADMMLINDVFKSNKEFRLVMANPVVRTDKKLSILHQIFGDHLQKISILFLDIITKSGRENIIMQISEQYIEFYKKHKGIITTSLKTVIKIDDDIRTQLIELLEKQTGAKIDLIEGIDESLIGGFVFKYDNLEYDASIRKQIQQMKKEFESNLYLKGF